MEEPIVNRKKTFSAVWILPLVALLIGAWLIYKSYQEQGVMITLRVNDASGLKVDKTQVYYKGIPVGIVRDMSVTDDLKHIELQIEMIKQSEDKLVEDTKFWLVRPKVTLNKVAGLDTLISGSYINVYPGKSKKLTKYFVALSDEIDAMATEKGRVFYLSSNDTVGHKNGEPVIYKKIKVGEVVSSTLYDNNKISVKIVIYKDYADMIDSSTLFWDVSGVKFDANLSGINVEVGTFESIIAGGIEFDNFGEGKKVDKNHVFPLFKNKKDALNSKKILITFKIPTEYGVAVGTEIKFKSVLIGKITDIKLSDDMKFFKAEARIIPRAKNILTDESYFWLVSSKIDFPEVKNVETIISGEYINVVPKEGNRANSFFLHKSPPLINRDGKGLVLILESDNLGSIKSGSPILYKKFKVGEVFGTELADNDKVLIYAYIEEKYKKLVKPNTKFWNISGIKVEGGFFSKISVETGSIKSLLMGGIAFYTPPNSQNNQTVKQNHVFKLYKNYDSEWDDKIDSLKLILKAENLGSLKEGSPVLYHQYKVGEISYTKLSLKDKKIEIGIDIFKPYDSLVNSSTKFWNISGVNMEGGLFKKINVNTGSFESLIVGGIEFETFSDIAEKVNNNDIFKLYEKKSSNWFEKNLKKGLIVELFSDTLGSIKKGNPILYRQFKVGEVLNTKLSDDGGKILITGVIFEPYKKLVNTSSKFYNISGVQVEGGLFSKVKVNTGSVESVVTGGIAFVTPVADKKITNVTQHIKFKLYKRFNEEWFSNVKNGKNLELTLATDTLGSIKKGNPILYRQFKVGEVVDTELSITSQNILIHIIIYEQYKNLVNSETKFWNNSGIFIDGGLLSGMNINVGSVETILTGGISFATPDNVSTAKPIKNGYTFPLYKHVYKEWLDWDPYINIGLNQKSLDEIKNIQNK
jgi:paraquat-inducible protein B